MISNILFVGAVGSVFFTIFLIFMATSGWAKSIRDEEGHFKKHWNWKAIAGMFLFVWFLLGILFWGNSRLLSVDGEISFVLLFLNGFGIFMFLHLYDLLVLDYLVVIKWHPKFLKLPNTAYYNSMKPHLQGFVRGIPIGIVAALIAAALSRIF